MAAFTLEVTFSGICVYVVDEAKKRVGVLMPDARLMSGTANHDDGDKGEAHVGYLRFDLADLDSRFKPSGGDHPSNEVIHQFDREELTFTLTGDHGAATAPSLNLPQFEQIAPAPDGQHPQRTGIQLRQGLFDPTPPANAHVLMRTLVSEGTFTGTTSEHWAFDDVLAPGETPYEGDFATEVVWTCPVDTVTLKLRRFTDGREIAFPLTPADPAADPVVRVKVANFCETNPLEWQNLGLRAVGQADPDFKWLYHLLDPMSGTWKDVLGDQKKFPFPIKGVALDGLGVEDCLGGQIKGSTGG
ncbi:hypothetical protein [Longimicrobium sp.]|uniref:hypothetical protein n=1 Tax=Longimicrobium sp. TaxID=2029185 RepID=UPI002E2EF203|nr:hypothetical protein [Longimicrobium sp.]HEX6040573.1 hypothetical protein [Longimicrobium sp.]